MAHDITNHETIVGSVCTLGPNMEDHKRHLNEDNFICLVMGSWRQPSNDKS